MLFYESNVGSTSWTKAISHKLEVFQNRLPRRVLNILWPHHLEKRDEQEDSILNSSSRKCERGDGVGSGMFFPCLQRPYRELLAARVMMADEQEAVPRKLGGLCGKRWSSRVDEELSEDICDRQATVVRAGGGFVGEQAEVVSKWKVKVFTTSLLSHNWMQRWTF